MEYITKFENYIEYERAKPNLILPNVSLCTQEDEVYYNPWSFAEVYLTFLAKENGTFTFTPQNSNVISYSTDDGETWTEGNTVSVNNGDKIMWKGTMTPSKSGIGTFSSTASFDVQGNVMSLLYGDNYKEQTDLTGKNRAFHDLFKNNTKVVNARSLSLPATTLSNNCYYSMFQGCTSLTTAPELPATTLGGYCYNYMFQDCTNLTTAPMLPATTLTNSCYYSMFRGCTNLTKAPKLPATQLAIYCYSTMFRGCTSLTKAPELPATQLTTSCYYSMFQGCTNLSYIKAMFTTMPSAFLTCTTNWVDGVSSSGTFVKNSAATWTTTGTDGIPNGWTVETASE